MPGEIKKNVKWVYQQIEESARKSYKSKEDIRLVAVTKYAGIEQIEELVRFGVTEIGENKVQEALPKIESLSDMNITWHFVGHLQSNKVKYVIDHISLYQSLDRISLAKELNKRAQKKNRKINALVQVNIGEEEQKHGLSIEEVESFVDLVLNECNYLNIQGLMTMPPYTPDPEDNRALFNRMKQLFDLLSDKFGHEYFQYLSMGMSHDFQVAIEEGANMVRIGRVLFQTQNEGGQK